MSDEGLSFDALREVLQRSNQQAEEERQRQQEEVKGFARCQEAVRAFEKAIDPVRERVGEARLIGQSFDPGPYLSEIAARLAEVRDTLRDNDALARLDTFHRDEAVSAYFRPEEDRTTEQARLSLAFAERWLRGLGEESHSLDQLVRELWFEPGLRPAGKWLWALLRMLVNLNSFPAKAEPSTPEAAPEVQPRERGSTSGDEETEATKVAQTPELDSFACPECGSVLPEHLRTLPAVRCPTCGHRECKTGVTVLPVASSSAASPAIVQIHAPYWLPVRPSAGQPAGDLVKYQASSMFASHKISWDLPKTGPAPNHYILKVYGNNVCVFDDRVYGTSKEVRLHQGQAVHAVVVAVDWSGRLSEPIALGFTSAVAPQSPPAPPTLDGLRHIRAISSPSPSVLSPEPVPAADYPRDLSADLVSTVAGMKTRSFLDWAGGDHVTLAIVFTDVVGSTAINTELGDEQMREVRNAHFAQGREFLHQHNGWEIKTMGDSFMAAFRSVSVALDFALAIYSQTGHSRLRVRASIHVGAVEVKDEDVHGSTVNLAARIISMIKGAEIWVSDQAKQQIDDFRASRHRILEWRRHDGREMKGFLGQFTLWQLTNPPA